MTSVDKLFEGIYRILKIKSTRDERLEINLAGGNQIEGAFKDVCITEHCFDANFARNPTAAVIVLGSGLKFLARTDLPKLLTALIAVR